MIEPERRTGAAQVADAAVLVEGLVKTFGRTRALDGLDLVVPRGSVLGLLGPNGAGKTTAVRVLSTLLRADSGRAEVAGIDVARDPQRVRQMIGLTGQFAARAGPGPRAHRPFRADVQQHHVRGFRRRDELLVVLPDR